MIKKKKPSAEALVLRSLGLNVTYESIPFSCFKLLKFIIITFHLALIIFVFKRFLYIFVLYIFI